MISTLVFPIFTSESKILNNNKLSLHICERILQKKFIVNEGVEKINAYTKSPNPAPPSEVKRLARSSWVGPLQAN